MKRKLRAPFIPKTTDPESMRTSTDKIVKLKHFEETVIPFSSQEVIMGMNREVFNDFGTNIEQSLREKTLLLKRESQEFKERQLKRVLEDSEEETKPSPPESYDNFLGMQAQNAFSSKDSEQHSSKNSE